MPSVRSRSRMARSSRPGRSQFGIEPPELGIGLVELHELALLVEDRDRRRERIDQAAEMLDAAGERGQGREVGPRDEIAGACLARAETRRRRRCPRRRATSGPCDLSRATMSGGAVSLPRLPSACREREIGRVGEDDACRCASRRNAGCATAASIGADIARRGASPSGAAPSGTMPQHRAGPRCRSDRAHRAGRRAS